MGIFGGSFDPPHPAHLALAQAAVQQLALDKLWVLPTGQAWHKPATATPAAHRLAMARLAFTELPGCQRISVDARELNRPGPSYTIDTLRELSAEHATAQWLVQIGADQALRLQHWHRFRELAQCATFSVAIRAGETLSTEQVTQHLEQQLGPKPPLVFLDLPAMPHSSSRIRQQLAAGVPAHTLVQQGLLAAAVARYIDDHHLYRNACP